MIFSKKRIFKASLLLVISGLFTGCTSVSQPSIPAPQGEKKIELQTFAPTFPPGKDAYDSVHSIYRSSKAKPTGVFSKFGVVFVIVNIDLKKEKLRYIEGTAMLRSNVLLRKAYKLPARFKLPCRLIESRHYRKQRAYRYALAYRESDVLKLSGKR